MTKCRNYNKTVLAMTFLLFAPTVCCAQSDQDNTRNDASTIQKIETILAEQGKCWNNKDIDGFMKTYWKSEHLTFCSGGNTRRGWQATSDGYKKSYPPEKMGTLKFDHLKTTLLSPGSAFVLGQWHLDVNGKKDGGNFTLILKKFGDDWKIIHDHTSVLEKKTNLKEKPSN